jgi:hypothetical protein
VGDKVLWSSKLRHAEHYSGKLDQKLRKNGKAGTKGVLDRLNAEVAEAERDNRRKAEECRQIIEKCVELDEQNAALLRRNGVLQVQLADCSNIQFAIERAERLQAENEALLRSLTQQEALAAQQRSDLQSLTAEAWEGQRLYSAQVSCSVSRAPSPVDQRKELRQALKKLQHERNILEIEGRSAPVELKRLIAAKSQRLRGLSHKSS